MSNHLSIPISCCLAQPARNKRRNATQACDSCRRRKRQCDTQRPSCSSCRRVQLECTYNRHSLKRGRKADTNYQHTATPWTTFKSTGSSSTNTSNRSSENSNHQRLAALNPFSRGVTDHLVELFFEHCFQDYNFFCPVNFLRQYVQGTVNQDLLHAICASVATFSEHPAIARTPLSSNGQIYVDRVKSRMAHLISQVSVDVIHTLIILARAEYNAGNAHKGIRVTTMAIAMALELKLHLSRPPEKGKLCQSEAERIELEVKIMTVGNAAIHDWILSLVGGMPGMFEHIVVDWSSTGFRKDWWIERMSSTTEEGQQWMELLDDYSIRILRRIIEPSRLKNVDLTIHVLQLVKIGRLVRKFCQSVSSLGDRENHQCSKVRQGMGGADCASTTKVGTTEQQHVQEIYRQAEDALEHWRANLPREMQPSRAKDMVSRLEAYEFLTAEYYYALVIQLHRPFLLKASMAISSRKKKLPEKAKKRGSEDMEEEELEQCENQRDLQTLESCLGKCLAAADEFVAMIEQFTEEDIKYRGCHFGFCTFIVGTVYIIQGIVDEASKGVQTDKDRLAICRRFLQKVGVHYASAMDGDYLLGRLSSTNFATKTTMEESRGNSASSLSSAMENLSDIALPSPLMDAEEINNFETVWLEGLTAEEAEEWRKMRSLFALPAEEDSQQLAAGYAVEVGEDVGYHAGWSFAPQVVSDSVDTAFSSTTTASAAATAAALTTTTTTTTKVSKSTSGGKTRHEAGSAATTGDDTVEERNAFITTDSGLGTLWMHPEKLASLEEATLMSLEKLSMF